MAVALFNRGEDPAPMTFTAAEVGVAGAKAMTDAWTGTQVSPVKGSYTFVVPKHGVVLLRINR